MPHRLSEKKKINKREFQRPTCNIPKKNMPKGIIKDKKEQKMIIG